MRSGPFYILILFNLIFFVFFIFNYEYIDYYLLIPGIILPIITFDYAGDMLTDFAYAIGNKLNFTGGMVGIYIISFFSVIDELITASMAAFYRYGSISFGTIEGSNFITLLFFIFIIPFLKDDKKGYLIDILFLIFISLIILLISLYLSSINIIFSIVLIVIFVIYILAVNRNEKKNDVVEYYPVDYLSIAAIFMVFTSSYMLVKSVDIVSYVFSINGFLSSFIIIGIAGSIPELVLTYMAIKKDMIASSRILTGSTVYKFSLVPGIAAMLGTVYISHSYYYTLSIIFMGLLIVIISMFQKPQN
ncbi:sodium/calcium exchanger protein [Picrophilus oshimae]|uniref:Sodium/calcium exchanger protein n=1 Tax=Picrophilus torridus (strain ATCC 700027 / DSM 9790 / JCM 10055 / NBRC 100828 / KAW 2/3) TaxID=1122961 RepID=Q6KZI2_PICTO|nr:sodium/calcium exchanger protein [Picrophilus oshimae DSM 9789]